MRRAVLIVFTCALVAGCGSKGITSPAPRTVIGALPEPFALVTPYIAAVTASSANPDAARALIAYLSSAAAREKFKAAGL